MMKHSSTLSVSPQDSWAGPWNFDRTCKKPTGIVLPHALLSLESIFIFSKSGFRYRNRQFCTDKGTNVESTQFLDVKGFPISSKTPSSELVTGSSSSEPLSAAISLTRYTVGSLRVVRVLCGVGSSYSWTMGGKRDCSWQWWWWSWSWWSISGSLDFDQIWPNPWVGTHGKC